MCELCLPRRAVLVGGAGVVSSAVLAGRGGWAAAAPAAWNRQATPPPIVPRAEWGPDLAPTGPIPDELDVRFLLVHHTVNSNDYAPEDVPRLLAGIYGFHTSPERGWPDIAYNFFVDRFGTVYEGRTGSLAGPKAADATGGSQGFAQLCTFLGDHSVELPSEAAISSMAALLAFLADRHALDLTPGATTTFVSRGSNRQPAGTEVTTLTVSGHRDMSVTACPGDAAYAMVADGTFARLATERRVPPPATTTPPTSPPATSTDSTTTSAPTTTVTTTTTSTTVSSSEAAAGGPAQTSDRGDGGDGGSGVALPAAVAAAAAGAAALLALRTRRHNQSRPGV